MQKYVHGGEPIHTDSGDKTVIIYDVSDEMKALLRACRAYYQAALIDGGGGWPCYDCIDSSEFEAALEACKDIPCT